VNVPYGEAARCSIRALRQTELQGGRAESIRQETTWTHRADAGNACRAQGRSGACHADVQLSAATEFRQVLSLAGDMLDHLESFARAVPWFARRGVNPSLGRPRIGMVVGFLVKSAG